MQDPWRPRGSHGSPPPSQAMNGHGPDLSFLMKHLLERADESIDMFHRLGSRIDLGFQAGEQRMDRIEQDVREIKSRPEAKPPPLPGWEIALKRPMPWIIAVLALAMTGKLDVAVRLVEALGKIAAAVK